MDDRHRHLDRHMESELDELDFEDLGGDPRPEADTEVFYWALKSALERTPVEPTPLQ